VIKTPPGEEIREPHCAAPMEYATGTNSKNRPSISFLQLTRALL